MVKDDFHEKKIQEKDGELIHNFSIQYAIKNDQYPKTFHKSQDVVRKVKFKS